MTRPKDINPDSGNRLPLPTRDELDEAGKKRYDMLADPRGGSLAGLRGPGGLRLHSPKSSSAESALNQYLRTEAFSGRIRELAILVTARAFSSQFEWLQHEPAALKEGVEPAIVDIVKHRKPVEGLSESDAVIIRFGRELFGHSKVSSETFAQALKIFGKRQLVDLVSLMCNYASTAFFLAAFDVQLPDGVKPPLS